MQNVAYKGAPNLARESVNMQMKTEASGDL